MRHFVSAAAASAVLVQSAAALAQTSDPSAGATPAEATKPLSTCDALARDWRGVEIDLAKRNVEEIGDNSAPRATMRAIRDGNSLQVAAITLSLMRENKCPLPKRPPSYVTYMLPAMECQTEELKANYKAPQCETANWKPVGK